ncbi:MAG: hypothetical protein GY745_17035 [Actinomycetia bacterium]|nr:hypothetical protein [Actinomycetes bacterium]
MDGTTETVEVGTIATPWATDANQTPVPTRFTVDGTALTQHIEHTNTEHAYPIVADPEYHSTWYGKYTIKLTTSELRKLKGAIVGTGSVAGIVCSYSTVGLCALASAVVGGIVGGLMGALLICENSKGVDIHFTAIPRVIWCNGY